MSADSMPSTFTTADRQLIRCHRRELANLPEPSETWKLQEIEGLSFGLFHRLLQRGLITADREPTNYIPGIWRTTDKLWNRLEQLGAVDENGRPVNNCGENGLLPCGSNRFLNERGSDRLRCKTCDTVYSKQEVRD